jgi:hypothetical protein
VPLWRLKRFDSGHCEPQDITLALEQRAAGPDQDLITEEEACWRVDEHMVPLMQGDWGWEVEKHLDRLFEERDKSKEAR